MSDAGDPMAALRARFLVRCADDLATITTALQTGGAAGDDLKTVIHRLSGTAGTFGFWEISAVAGPIDDLLHEGQTPPAAQFQVLADALRDALKPS